MNRPTSRHLVHRASVVTALALLLMGCVAAPTAPPDSMAEARQAITRAEQSGARQYAGAELDEARERLEQSERAFEEERVIEADRYALQSQVSAQLASARTEAAKASEINREMTRGADALREEMRRTGDQQ